MPLTTVWYGKRGWMKPVCRMETKQSMIVIIRYADVLLMYAEAMIEKGTIDDSVLKAINQVRARAYGVKVEDVSNYPAVTTTDRLSFVQSCVRNAVWNLPVKIFVIWIWYVGNYVTRC